MVPCGRADGERSATGGGVRGAPARRTLVRMSQNPRAVSRREAGSSGREERGVRARRTTLVLLVAALTPGSVAAMQARTPRPLREVNTVIEAPTATLTAIVGATLIDGRGGAPVPNAVVVVRGGRIVAAGPRARTPIPRAAAIVEAGGLAVLPGLIDAHFHLDSDDSLPALYLRHGVTSVRDPGAWIESYTNARAGSAPVPRLFLAGPHLDFPPPVFPKDALTVRDEAETRLAVNRLVDQGASSIKAYFRMPLGLVRAAAEEAHRRGVPITAHLEIVSAVDAINAGVDGLEHITSFGTSLEEPRAAERYRQAVHANPGYRSDGRYALWSGLDLQGPRVKPVLDLVAQRGTWIDPTLAVFEVQQADSGSTSARVRGFEQMVRFAGLIKGAGGRVVVGSHSDVPHAARGWAYQRELELLVRAGLTPMEAILAGTRENARYFRVSDRLGTIEAGKLADLVLVQGNPLADIAAMRNVRRVMLAGRWIVAGEP